MPAKATKEEATDVAIRENMTPAEAKDVFGEPVPADGIELRLGQIKVAHQNQVYELPGGDMAKEFDGMILDIVNVNAWWEKSFDESGGNEPPQCFSMDGIEPSPMSEKIQSEQCAGCSRNKFGSDGKRGKACKNMKRVHIMFEGELFPKRLTVPPTSLEPINVYASALQDKGIPYNGVITEFGLKESKNKEGIMYSQVTLTRKGFAATSQEEYTKIKALRERFLGAMREQKIEGEEYGGD